MARYSATTQAAAGTTVNLMVLNTISTVNCNRLYDLIIGSDAAPADAAGEYVVMRGITNPSTATVVPVLKLDPVSPPNVGTAMGTPYTGVPVVTAGQNLLMIALNQRATFRWVAVPGSEIRSVVGANETLVLRCVDYSTGTPNINCTMMWEE